MSLHFKKIRAETRASESFNLSGFIISPPLLKTRSAGELDAGTLTAYSVLVLSTECETAKYRITYSQSIDMYVVSCDDKLHCALKFDWVVLVATVPNSLDFL